MLQLNNNRSITHIICIVVALYSIVCEQPIHAEAFYLRHAYTSNDVIELQELRNNWTYVSAFGECRFSSETYGLARIILVDEDENEYLIGEWDKRFNSDTIFTNVCLETAYLQSRHFSQIRIIVHNATLIVDSIELSTNSKLVGDSSHVHAFSPRQMALQWNRFNVTHGKHWYAKQMEDRDYSFNNIKNTFYCDDDNYYSIGIEYYAGGLFEIDGVTTETDEEEENIPSRDNSNYVNYFDWRNRHGKNWITPVKSQILPTEPIYGNGGCWAFTAVAATEAATQLYFNRLLNLDLSEQDVGVCSSAGSLSGGTGCGGTRGGSTKGALDYIRDYGVCDEYCFPFANNCTIPCTEKCNNPAERINIDGATYVYPYVSDYKAAIINHGPITSGVQHRYYWHDSLIWCSHAMCMIGFGTISEGDVLRFVADTSYNDCYIDTIIHAGDPLIGHSYWIFKNSFGEINDNNGFLYAVFPEMTTGKLKNIGSSYWINTPITSLNYSDSDIAVTDEDNDGYYFWGLGAKPAHCPVCCPDSPDGDDSDPTKGVMDSYGNFSTYLFPYPDIIKSNTFFNLQQDSVICGNLYLNQTTMLVNANLTMNPAAKIVVNSGSLLLLNQNTTTKATIIVKSGGKLQIQNGAVLNLRNKGCLQVELGGEFVITEDSNVIIEQ